MASARKEMQTLAEQLKRGTRRLRNANVDKDSCLPSPMIMNRPFRRKEQENKELVDNNKSLTYELKEVRKEQQHLLSQIKDSQEVAAGLIG